GSTPNAGDEPPPAPPEAAPARPDAKTAAESPDHAGDAAASTGATTATVLPALTPLTDCRACPELHRPDPESERDLSNVAREVSNVVMEAAQDLGLTLDVSARAGRGEPPTDDELVEAAKSGWVFSPRVSVQRKDVTVRIVAVAPGSSVVLARSAEFSREDIEVKVVLMMRDLYGAARGGRRPPIPTPEANEHAVVHAARSRGRAVLALNAAALGGYVGFSLQRAGGSNDARLTYPLIALGTGIGLGGSMIVADEWDVGLGDAWYLSAGTWWPALGALLVAHGEPDRKRFLYGSGAAGGGLALATVSLTFGGIGEGSAVVAHSGGAFGLLLGGITDLAIQGRTDLTPSSGMGVGAITGVILSGALARFTPSQASSRVLLVDLSAGLGALTGAAVASPLVFGDDVGKTRNRLWLSTIALGTFIGAGVGLFSTQDHTAQKESALPTSVAPFAGVVAVTPRPDGSVVPATGVGVRGVW
ncbi:MAG TPA: hypothetical protein VHE30_28595, partial [Polyangiaceae bacterium]|nr:hypothetical protein [Polyangiaceae bacterium]